MRRGAMLFFPIATVAGVLLLALGTWILLVAAIPSPTVMASGALTLALTALAWRAHRRARATDAKD